MFLCLFLSREEPAQSATSGSRRKRAQRRAEKQDGPGTQPEPETGTVGTIFPETERGTGTVGTVFQEPKPEPSLSVKTVLEYRQNPFLERNRQNRNPEPLELSHTRTVTEPNQDQSEKTKQQDDISKMQCSLSPIVDFALNRPSTVFLQKYGRLSSQNCSQRAVTQNCDMPRTLNMRRHAV